MYLAITLSDVFTQATTVLGSFWSVFGQIVAMITGNPLLYASILLGLGATLCMVVVTVVKKLGIRGIASGGGRRRRRR